MATLSDRDLVWAIRQDKLIIEPDIAYPIQPASIDLRLGHEFQLLPQISHLERIFDPAQPEDYSTLLTLANEDGHVRLLPGAFMLARTYEAVGIHPGLEGIVTGKSSWARVGLQIESAGYIDPGWGYPKPQPLTLEIVNLGSLTIILRPLMKICQLRVAHLNSEASRPYGHPDLGSHYADSDGVVGGRFTLPDPAPISDE